MSIAYTKINMLVNLLKHRKLLIIGGLTLIIIIAAFFSSKKTPSFTTPQKNQINSSKGLITPSSKQTKQTTFVLETVSPPPPTYESLWSTHKITFTFNEVVDKNTIIYRVSPPTKTRLIFDDNNPKSFSILSLTGWGANQPYTFTINSSLKSINGQSLPQDINVTLTRIEPSLNPDNFPPGN